MTTPVGIIAAIAALQAAQTLYSIYEQRKAHKANKKELENLRKTIQTIQDPNFDYSKINAEQYKVLQDYVPEFVPFVQEQVPEKVKMQSESAKKAQQARIAALDQMLRVAQTGEDPIAAIERSQAARRAAAEAGAARATLEREMARRGMLSGGLEYAGALTAADRAAERMALAEEQALMNREAARRAAAMGAADIGGQVYDDEYRIERANVEAMNEFNRRMAERQQELAQHNIGLRNEAQLRNIAAHQRAADLNVGLANERTDKIHQLEQQRYQNALSKYDRQAQLSDRFREHRAAVAADRIQTAKGIADAGSTLAYGYGRGGSNLGSPADAYGPGRSVWNPGGEEQQRRRGYIY